MPIPLGILAAAGVRPTAGGSYELIETYNVTSQVAQIVFDISSYSTTYQHLQLRYTARKSSQTPGAKISINSTGLSYMHDLIGGSGSTPISSATSGNANFMTPLFSPTFVSNNFTAGVLDILDIYETGKNKTFRQLWGYVDPIESQIGRAHV